MLYIVNESADWVKGFREAYDYTKNSFNRIFCSFRKNNLDEINEFLKEVKVSWKRLESLRSMILASGESPETISFYTASCNNLEKVLFNIEKIAEQSCQKIKEGVFFTDKAATELKKTFTEIETLFPHLSDILLTGNKILLEYLDTKISEIEKVSKKHATEHEERLIKGVCLAKSSSIYLFILDSLQDILYHLKAIAKDIHSRGLAEENFKCQE